MKRTTHAAATSALLALTLVSSAHACGYCTLSQIEPQMPAVVPWSIIGAVAYGLVPVFIRPDRDRLFAWLFSPAYVFIIIVALTILGVVAIGPLGLLLLLALACVGSARALILSRNTKSILFASVLAAAIIGSWAYTSFMVSKLDEIGLMARWPGSPNSRVILNRFLKAGDLASLRRVVQVDAGWESVRAAQYLAEHGSPEIDGPLLIGLLRRTEIDDGMKRGNNDVSRSLEVLLPGSRPATSTADAWQAAFDARMAKAASGTSPPNSASK